MEAGHTFGFMLGPRAYSAALGAGIVATFKRCTYPFVFGVAFPPDFLRQLEPHNQRSFLH